LKSQQIKKLKSILKKHLRGNIADIIIVGSFLKNKLSPSDIDVVVLFKERKLKGVEEDLFEIKESLDSVEGIHIEPLFVDSMFKEGLFLSVLHEGFSIKENKTISELLKVKAYSIFSYGLENLSKVDKVKFAQALYGRKKDGLIYSEKCISLGSGSFMVQVDREEIFKEFFNTWKIKFLRKRAFVSD